VKKPSATSMADWIVITGAAPGPLLSLFVLVR
jgi:hypothetical protein